MDHRRPNRLQPIRWNYSCRLAFRVAARGGQAEKETRSAIRSVFRADRATVHFNNGANDGQSHAHSSLLGGKEMIEHSLRPVLRQAGAEIAHTTSALSPLSERVVTMIRRSAGGSASTAS